jgi:aminoglycoside phosphotransferase
MLSAEFIGACLEAKFSPLVSDDRADTEVFRSLRQLKVTGETVAVATGDGCVPQVLFLVEKASIAEAGFLCVQNLS